MKITTLLVQLKRIKAERPEDFYKFMNKMKQLNYELYKKIKVNFSDDGLVDEEPFNIIIPFSTKRRFWLILSLIVAVSFFAIVYSFVSLLLSGLVPGSLELQAYCYTPNRILVYSRTGALLPAFSSIEVLYNNSIIYSSSYTGSNKVLDFNINSTLLRAERYDIKLNINDQTATAYCFSE